ncbi:MAG TPA: DUF2177 family protein [Candidatus Paceibacterota bacterium]|nr:DUF2177 family protein [Candidatus Paceibacterota bacterium]
MKNTLVLALLIVPTLIILDLLWIGLIAQGIYQDQIGYLLATEVTWWAALLFYVIYGVALAHFVVLPAIKLGDMRRALYNGLLFGLAAFATYDLTNLATVRDWPVALTFIDMVYGTIVAGVTSATAYVLGKKLVRG